MQRNNRQPKPSAAEERALAIFIIIGTIAALCMIIGAHIN